MHLFLNNNANQGLGQDKQAQLLKLPKQVIIVVEYTQAVTYGRSGVRLLFLRLLRGYSTKMIIGDSALVRLSRKLH